MKVKTLLANWRQVGSTIDSCGADEDFDKYEVGENGVIEIQEFEPKNGMQLHNFLIIYEDGKRTRVFNPNHVNYFKSE